MFKHDILVVDFETSSLDPHKCSPLQIGAVLLDKSTLAIKAEFSEYMTPCTNDWDIKAQVIHGITREWLFERGMSHIDVFELLRKTFDFNAITIASWSKFDFQ